MDLDMDDPPLLKIAISGPTLASIIQRFTSSNGDVDGLLFGHVTPSHLPHDDRPSSSSSSSLSRSDSDSPPTLVASITCFFCSGTVCSFYDSLGRLDLNTLRRFLGERQPGQSLLGWFMGRRRTPLRPSMREFSVSASLCNKALNLVPPDDPLSPPFPSLRLPRLLHALFRSINPYTRTPTLPVSSIDLCFRAQIYGCRQHRTGVSGTLRCTFPKLAVPMVVLWVERFGGQEKGEPEPKETGIEGAAAVGFVCRGMKLED